LAASPCASRSAAVCAAAMKGRSRLSKPSVIAFTCRRLRPAKRRSRGDPGGRNLHAGAGLTMKRNGTYWVFVAPDPLPVAHPPLAALGLGLVELGIVGVVPEPF